MPPRSDAPFPLSILGADFQVGRALLDRLPDATYFGCDIVPKFVDFNNRNFSGPNVKFENLDIVSGDLPAGDVCLVRQVLQHLSNADISLFMKRQSYPVLSVTEGQPPRIVGDPTQIRSQVFTSDLIQLQV